MLRPLPVQRQIRHTAAMISDAPRRPAPADDPHLTALLDALTVEALAQAPAVSAATAAAVRYALAILASDAMGDGCRFPRCACSIMDCSRRRQDKPPPH